MVKLNFKEMPCYLDIHKKAKQKMDVRFLLGNSMYVNGHGVAYGALAIKIYNSSDEEEYQEHEVDLILEFSRVLPPIFYDSLKEYIEIQKQTT